MSFTGIDHVQVAAPPGCERDARAFYGGVLGMHELEKPEPLRARGGVWFACGAQAVHVGVDPDFAPARKAHPAIAVTDAGALARLAERVTAVGAEMHWDDELPGAVRFYTSDPFGNRLELVAPA
jgi:catechol 2,3-dioxygenase-like lactoylglutathione lyase family enzyme